MRVYSSRKTGARPLWLSALVMSFAFSAAAQQAPQDDTQSWNEVQLTVPLSKTIDLTASGQLRLGRDITDFVDGRGGMGLNFKVKVKKWSLSLAPFYLHIATQPTPDRRAFENRLNFAATVQPPTFKGFTVKNRHLFERRLRDPADSTRYRNRLTVEHPVKIGESKLTLFIADEIFYDWTVDAWVRNRASAGVGKTLNKTFAVDVYYLRQNDGRSRPGDLHVIGSVLRVRL